MSLAVLIPCHNEAITIYNVVRSFQDALPDARVYVYDNNSTDNTIKEAERAGAIVRQEETQGKGAVVRRMFADIEADIYIMVDGDGTYNVQAASQLVSHLHTHHLDMVIGTRVAKKHTAYRAGHALGNKMFNALLRYLFKSHFTDIFSGYRVFSRRFVKSFPALSTGFDVETEITIHALELAMPVSEIPTDYDERPLGSQSKLSTYKDGWKILCRIIKLFRLERPLFFFGSLSLSTSLLSVLLFLPILITYWNTGLVPRLPTFVLCIGLMLLSMLSLGCGMILDSVTYTRTALKRLHYLATSKSSDAPH